MSNYSTPIISNQSMLQQDLLIINIMLGHKNTPKKSDKLPLGKVKSPTYVFSVHLECAALKDDSFKCSPGGSSAIAAGPSVF